MKLMSSIETWFGRSNVTQKRIPVRWWDINKLLLDIVALLNHVSRAYKIEIRLSSSFVRLWHRLSLNLSHGFFFKLSCCFLWAIPPHGFWICEKKNVLGIFLRIFFIFIKWDSIGAISKRLSYKSQPEVFKLFLNFSSQWTSQNWVWDFWNFENSNFNEFFSFSLTWDSMGVKISKSYSPYISQPTTTCPEVSSQWSSQTYVGDFFKVWVSDF